VLPCYLIALVFPLDVTLSAAKGLSLGREMLRGAQHDSSRRVLPCYLIALVFPLDVTLSAAKGLSLGREMLRGAQHDKATLSMTRQ